MGSITFEHAKFKMLIAHQNEILSGQLNLEFKKEVRTKNINLESCQYRNGI